MIKYILFFTICINIWANNIVPVSKKVINWKDTISKDDVKFVEVDKNYKCKKEYIDMILLKSNKYRAKHFILKGKPICKKDVYEDESKIIRFNFGSLIIERKGEIIKENDKFIKIRNANGTIEKIYKDGSIK